MYNIQIHCTKTTTIKSSWNEDIEKCMKWRKSKMTHEKKKPKNIKIIYICISCRYRKKADVNEYE